MRNNQDKGSIALIAMVAFIALLGFGSLATDMAVLYVEKSRLQHAVDASALAGSQELPYNSDAAISNAFQYATTNNVNLTSVQVSADNREILVITEKDVPLYLARILGIESRVVTASARAGVLPAHTVIGSVPLSVTPHDFVWGEEYLLKTAPPEGVSGWYGPLIITESGARSYEDGLAYGCDPPLSVGQILQVEHGNMAGATKKGIDTRLSLDTRVPRNTFEDHDRNAPQIVYVPVVEVVSTEDNSIHEVKILGFAAFFIEEATENGEDAIIKGRYLQTIVSDGREISYLNEHLEGSNEYGLFASKLLN